WTAPLVFRREGSKHEIYVALRGLHRQSELAPRKSRPHPAPPEKPGDPPDKDKPNEEPKRDEPQPYPKNRRPTPPAQPESAVPEEFRHLLEEKDGYANYHFNKVEQERVWAAMSPFDPWKTAAGRWKLTGKTLAGDEFALTLADQGIGLTIKNTPYFQPLGE